MGGPIVDLVLLRGLFADTALRPGVVLPAKVLEREGARGWLLLNGVRVNAQLPPELAAGDVFRVRVQEATGDRLALQVLPQAAPGGATPRRPPSASRCQAARGFASRSQPDSRAPRGGEGGRRSITLRFDSPALGRLDFLIELAPDAASARVGVAAGAADVAAVRRTSCAAALAEATARRAEVRVEPREETLDVRA